MIIAAYRRHIVAAALAGALWSGPALPADVPGASDHPLIARYEGADIVAYARTEEGRARIIEGPFDPANADRQLGRGFGVVSGRVTLIYYRLPPGHSLTGVMNHYEARLAAKGARVLFTCSTADGSCFIGRTADAGYYLGSAIGPALELPMFGHEAVLKRFDKGGRYLLARLELPESIVHASLFLGESADGNTAVLRVIETAMLDRDEPPFVNAERMREAIAANGRVALHRITFDEDAVTLRTESRPSLDEVAALMAAEPALKLRVVVHTDYKGTQAYNLDLSARRAERVVTTLVGDYDIAPERLSPHGAGFDEPVAPNDTEAGRSQNRRVELIAK